VKYTLQQHLLQFVGQVVAVACFIVGSTAATFLAIFWHIA
jgi:hypothetical protein